MITVAEVDRLVVSDDAVAARLWPRLGPRVRSAYLADRDRYVIVASNGGSPTNPDWYHNLVAHPEVIIEVGIDTIRAVASEATGKDRERLFQAVAARAAQIVEYQTKTDRVIPVMVLIPVGND